MPAGTTTLIYLQQPEPNPSLLPNASYFQVRLHSGQAYVEAPWFKQVAHLVCATQSSSTFARDHKSGSIHKLLTVKKDNPCPLGLRVNLTDWLPAVPQHTITVELHLATVSGEPFGILSDRIDQLDLESQLALVTPHLAIGARVAQMTAQILNVLLQEGEENALISLKADLNVNSLNAGLYAALAPYYGVDIPSALHLNDNDTLGVLQGHLSYRTNYAVFEVAVLERRGAEAARGLPWWEALQDAQAQIVQMPQEDEDDRRAVNRAWREAVSRTRRLAQQDQSFLLVEIQELLQKATRDFQRDIQGPSLLESTGLEAFPDDMREALGVATMAELEQSVATYEQALARSEQQRAQQAE